MPVTVQPGAAHAGLPDTQAFLGLLERLASGGAASDEERAAAALFDFTADLVVTRAPGRLDVMGGSAPQGLAVRGVGPPPTPPPLPHTPSLFAVADYSGSLVLQLPTAEACHCAAQRGPGDGLLVVVSLGADGHRTSSATLPAALLLAAGGSGAPAPYEAAHEALAGAGVDPARRWAAYPLGAVHALCLETGSAHFAASGLRLLLSSAVPEGKGVSSSAACEVATLFAAAHLAGVHPGGRTAALWCQLAENRVVGAPCGVMDQMASALGTQGALLALLCRPAEVQGCVPLPPGAAVWGLDSGVRHSVGGADYGTVRAAAFMGRAAAGLMQPAGGGGDDDGGDDGGDGGGGGRHRHLTEVAPHAWERDHAPALAPALAGAAFLEAHPTHGDAATAVLPGRVYPVRAAAGHPVHEHFRVRTFRALCAGAAAAGAGAAVPDETLALLGQLMHQSHESYGTVGLGAGGTDLLVRLVEAAGPRKGLFGAKITGGGSGGTVCVLGRADAGPAVAEVAAEYERRTGLAPHLFVGSSPGAAAFGALTVRVAAAAAAAPQQ